MLEYLNILEKVMSILKNGLEIVAKRPHTHIKFHLSAHWFGLSDNNNAMLVVVSVVNKSDAPYSVRSIDLIINGEQYKPSGAPAIEGSDTSGRMLQVFVIGNAFMFGRGDLEDFTLFPRSAYLKPNQETRGLLLFVLKNEIKAISKASVKLYIAGYDFELEQDLL